jgi:hypothetical protein
VAALAFKLLKMFSSGTKGRTMASASIRARTRLNENFIFLTPLKNLRLHFTTGTADRKKHHKDAQFPAHPFG